MASIFSDATGNQVLDGTNSYENELDLNTYEVNFLPRVTTSNSGFFVAANNQATSQSNVVAGSARSFQITKRLRNFLKNG